MTCGSCGNRDPKGVCEINGKKMNPGLTVGWCTFYEPITHESMLRHSQEKEGK